MVGLLAKRTIAIMQPTYLPWLGFFDLIRCVDLFVFYDDVQFQKQTWQQRNRIRNQDGELMLSVSVLKAKEFEHKINEIKIDNSQKILSKHLSSIRYAYCKSE